MRASILLSLIFFVISDQANTDEVDKIIEKRKEIREETYVVGVKDEPYKTATLPTGVKEVVMTDATGRKMKCHIPDGSAPPNTEIRASSEVEQEDDTDTGDLSRNQVVNKLRQLYSDKCITKTKDYWTYSVCPFKMVEQYHVEKNQKQMQFDLGFFVEPTVEEEDDMSHSLLSDYAQIYEKGTQKRSTRVTYRCQGDKSKKAEILSIEEPEELKYHIVVLTPGVCTGGKSMQNKDKSPNQLLLEYQNQCIFHNAGWWTYKHCHLLNLTQFHKENQAVAEKNTAAKWVMVAEFGLGELPKMSSSQVVKHGNVVVADRPEESYVSFRYNGGTPCDIGSQTKRETEVRWYCDPNEVNALHSVKEVSTCKYQMKIGANALCSHPAFTPTKPLVHEIECRPLTADE